MRSINHIVLDMENNKKSINNKYWLLSYLLKDSFYFFKDINTNIKFSNNLHINNYYNIFLPTQKFNIKLNTLSYNNKFFYKNDKKNINFFLNKTKMLTFNENLTFNSSLLKSLYTKNFLNTLSDKSLNIYNLNNLNLFFNKVTKESSTQNPLFYSLININFLRKERLYTKLKYSRTPAFDIVSGGLALLLAGFLGFLISEKYGFELGDSGDFYYLFMYIAILSLSIRPLLIVSDNNQGFFNLFSFYRVLKFYKIIILSFFNFFYKK